MSRDFVRSQLHGTPSPHMPSPTTSQPVCPQQYCQWSFVRGSIPSVLCKAGASPNSHSVARISCGSHTATHVYSSHPLLLFSVRTLAQYRGGHFDNLAKDLFSFLPCASRPVRNLLVSLTRAISDCNSLPRLAGSRLSAIISPMLARSRDVGGRVSGSYGRLFFASMQVVGRDLHDQSKNAISSTRKAIFFASMPATEWV